jgi:hypothetical protein
MQRADLLMQPSFDAVAMRIDAAESIQAENSLEKMLAHQMAIAHQMRDVFHVDDLTYSEHDAFARRQRTNEEALEGSIILLHDNADVAAVSLAIATGTAFLSTLFLDTSSAVQAVPA